MLVDGFGGDRLLNALYLRSVPHPSRFAHQQKALPRSDIEHFYSVDILRIRDLGEEPEGPLGL